MFKTCDKCGMTKPIEQFHVNAQCPDGRKYSCAVCENARTKRMREEKKKELADNRVTYEVKDHDYMQEEFEKLLVLGVKKGVIITPKDIGKLVDGWNKIARIQKVV